MFKPHRRAGSILKSLCLAIVVTWAVKAHAQMTVGELSQAIRSPNAVTKIGADLFGDQINLYNGALQFNQTDVSLKGNNALPVAVGRRLVVSDIPISTLPFGGWELDIPYMHGRFAKQDGWNVDSGNPLARCTGFSTPFATYEQTGLWESSEFWQGNYMYIPGEGEQQLLARDWSNVNVPSPAANYPVVTSRFWSISCLPTLANSSTQGEGFLALSPDGTSYRFDQIISYAATTLSKPREGAMMALATVPEPQIAAGGADDEIVMSESSASRDDAGSITPMVSMTDFLSRKDVRLLPTLVTDRYGNWVRYTYDTLNPENVKTITASDGRALTLSYNHTNPKLITSVSDGTRTWNYTYGVNGVGLTVTLPDGSAWQLSAGHVHFEIRNLATVCGESFTPTETWTGSMVHPSGATGTFTATATKHGRSSVVKSCPITNGLDRRPLYFYTYSLTNKTISGAGMAPLAWTYAYGPPNASYSSCTTCPTSKTVDVTDPDFNVTRYTFGNQYRVSEGRVEHVDVGWNGSSALKSTSTHYRAPGAGPYPSFQGTGGEGLGDGEALARLMPVDARTTTQQGVDFTWTADSFDTKARPLSVTRASSLGDSRSETTVYADNLSKWVLGQIGNVTGPAIGGSNVMVQNAYDPTSANLLTVSHFGHLDETFTYNADGTLATRKDGKNQTTTYTNYKRGVPQLIQYPTGYSESAVVNNIGTIASTTDQNGYTTSYGYDLMGRLNLITYPGADTVAWNTTSLLLEQVPGNEMGIVGSHWRQTISTGNARKISYFDALWRPVLERTFDAANPNGSGNAVLRRFDFNGNATFASYPQLNITDVNASLNGITTTYDALGRSTLVSAASELGALNTRVDYNSGFQKAVTNPRNVVTTTSFQAFDEPTEGAPRHITAAEGVMLDIVRDVYGKTKSITRSGNGKSVTGSYVYDAFQRLCKTIDAETGATVVDYDAANNVTWRASGNALPSTVNCDTASVPAAKKITFGYDTLNRLLSTTFSDASPAIVRTYTPDGLPATNSANGAVWTNTYNKRRLNERESLAYGGYTYNIDRSYTANAALQQLKYPDGATVAYNPNALGQASQIGSYASALTYHPNGPLAVSPMVMGSRTR
ncbi:MAG: hypothetical protein V4484_21220 [Pseudomonadota bacterium]